MLRKSLPSALFILSSFLFLACDKECKEKECTGYHTKRWDPVCGCNGKTYQNAEWAECHGIDDYSPGECEEE